MRKLILFTTSLTIFMVLILPGFLALGIKMVPFADQPGYATDTKRSIYGEKIITQEFVPQETNLTAIAMTIGNPNLKNKKEIILRLFDDKGNFVRTSTLNGYNVADGAFVKFVFEPITDSKNKKYVFSLSSPEAGPEEVIYTFITTDVPSWIGEVTYEGEENIEGGLPFVTFHKPASQWEVVSAVYSRFLPRSWQKLW